MKYTVELKEGSSIIDLCYAIKDIGRVVPTEYKPIELNKLREEALEYIEKSLRIIPLSSYKLRLLDIKKILEGGMNE